MKGLQYVFFNAIGYITVSSALTNVWPSEPRVVTRLSPPKGDGVFADESISQGTFVCRYHGTVLTIEEEEELYPNRFPDYCLRISPSLSIDGQDSGHWSRLINHNEEANLKLHTDEDTQTAHFTAARAIDIGEELCFDYGVAYFIFRQITPAPGTESRSLEIPREKLGDVPTEPLVSPPRDPAEIQKLLESDDTIENKKSALMRGLDFYGGVVWMETEDQVELLISFDGTKRTFAYSALSMDDLCQILEKLWRESQ
jgi:hypothetical protein